MKTGKLWLTGRGLCSLLLLAERVCLWATATRLLWGVRVRGLAASGHGVCLEEDGNCRRGFGANIVEGSSPPL